MPSPLARASESERRSVVRLQAGMLFVLVLVLIAAYELFEHRTSKHIGNSPPVVVTGVSENRPIPDVKLTDASGKVASLSALRARVVVLAPFATLCSVTCAATTSAFASLESDLRKAGVANQVALVELSVDPTHDGPASLASFARETGATWKVMSGSSSQVSQLWSALGQYYQLGKASTAVPRDGLTGSAATYGVTYSNGVYFLSPAGSLRISDFAAPSAPLDAGAKRLLTAEGVPPAAPVSTGWTASQAFGNIEVLFNRRLPL